MVASSHRVIRLSGIAFALASALLGASGCEVLLGITKHSTNEAADGDAGSDGGTCALPSSGDGAIRFGNFVPSLGLYDVCLKRTDGAAPIDDRPLLASSGCASGLGYKEVLAPIHVPAGTYTVTAIAAGAACSSGVASQSVAIDAGGVSVFLLGDGAKDFQLRAYREAVPSQLNSKIRFVHAIDGAPSFDVGLADNPTLPAKVTQPIFASVPFTGVAAAGSTSLGSIDSLGYVEASLLGADLQLGVAAAGDTKAIILSTPHFKAKQSYTLLAVGKPSDVAFPEEVVVCSELENDGVFTRCGNGLPFELTIDVFDPYLWGPFALKWPDRRGPAVDAIGKLTSDVACVPDIFDPDDQKALLAAAKAHFPYAAHFDDTLTTPADDPRDQSGATPPIPSVAPCGNNFETRMNAVLDCLRDNCSTKAGDDTAVLLQEPSACFSEKCTNQLAPLILTGGDDGKACYVCLITQLEGVATIGDARKACATDPRARLAFGGGSGAILLSRFPIANAEQYVLPSTDWRSNVIRAPITLDNGAHVDSYCAITTSPAGGITRPYTGQYGNGKTDADAWQAEQLLQMQRIVDWIGAKSGPTRTRALIAGEFYAGPELPGVAASNPDAFRVLSAAFPLAVARDFTPTCTFCADNPITAPPGTPPTGASTWTTYTLLANVALTDVRASSLIFTDAVIDFGSYKIPLSPYYGFRTSVRIAP